MDTLGGKGILTAKTPRVDLQKVAITIQQISVWTIRLMFDQSSVSWYNRVRSLTTSRNRLNLTLLYVSQYPCIFSYFKWFSKLYFNISIDFSRILCLFITTAIFTGSGCFW